MFITKSNTRVEVKRKVTAVPQVINNQYVKRNDLAAYLKNDEMSGSLLKDDTTVSVGS